ncbi:unnamed protein product [Peronospora farinosa]|uniref:SP-RING-type domain-containing protein n=1 Tax=Peronospora farinosa TaxID=134698 RepID=A0AAV0UYE9_9STRA|nr:unnamed protein product [Peronospora farinosa]CAI5739719.1 unnamed protein product [Peronospora farinosa]
MAARRDEYLQDQELFVTLAEDSKSVLFELGSLLNQHYRDRNPAHETQQVLRRKNETIKRLNQFITRQQRSREWGERFDQETYENQQSIIERLKKQLQDQKAVFDRERTRLQEQQAVRSSAQGELGSSLRRVLPQLRELLEAYDREQGQFVHYTHAGTTSAVKSSNEELSRRLKEMETDFDAERENLMEEVDDALATQREIIQQNWVDREAALTCPISLDLFEDPVITTCCGKTFSSDALKRALGQNHQCPVCRSYTITVCENRDIANLVELHSTELLDLPEYTVTSSTTGRLAVEEGSDRDRELMTSARPNDSVHARADTPHRQSSRTTTHSGSSSLSTPTVSSQAPQRMVSRNVSASTSTANTTLSRVAQISLIQRAINALPSTSANTAHGIGVGGNSAQGSRATTSPALSSPIVTIGPLLQFLGGATNNSLLSQPYDRYNDWDSDY